MLTASISKPGRLEPIAISSSVGLAAAAQLLDLFGLAGILTRDVVLTFFGVAPLA
jgi:hypothetical protein